MNLFERLYIERLREKFYPIDGKLDDVDDLYDEQNLELYPYSIPSKLSMIEFKSDWRNIGVVGDDARAAVMRISRFCDKSWVSLDKNDNPTGVFGIKEEPLEYAPERFLEFVVREVPDDIAELIEGRDKHFMIGQYFIEEIAMLSFQENNITFTKDVLNKMKELEQEYQFVSWSVERGIPAENLYNKWVPKNNGYQWFQTGVKSFYVLSKHFSS